MKPRITHKKLVRLLDYDPKTGRFTWRIKRGRLRAGERAGCVCLHVPYWKININRTTYLSHRLAWFYVHKKWPKDQIDHINGVYGDDRIANLRESSQQQNMRNKQHFNKHGLRGICLLTRPNLKKPWMARIVVKGKPTFIGTYTTKEQAHAAWCAVAKKQHGAFFYDGTAR